MISQRKILASVLLATMVAAVAVAQDWAPTLAPPGSWPLAASGDGRTLFAGALFAIFSSTNSGGTWTSTSAPDNYWDSLACSVDGSVVLASAIIGGVYFSTNSGTDWVLALSGAGGPVACSADGKRMVVTGYTSTNSGADWVRTSFPFGGPVAMSADGSRLAFAGTRNSTAVNTSTNFGLTWTLAYPTPESMYPVFVATSGEGACLIAVSLQTNLSPWYLPNSNSLPLLVSMSSDWGATWRQVGSITNLYGDGYGSPSISAACSADGATLAVAESPGNGRGDITGLVLSTNSGASWSTQVWGSTNLCSMVSSVDGRRLAAALGGNWSGQSMYMHKTTPVPALKILSGRGNLALSWLLPSEPFVLEESPDLLTWSRVGVTPLLNYTNLHYVANLPTPIGPKFYRLISQ